MTTFTQLLARFAACAEADDGAGLAALFTPDGVYDDYFFGPHAGRAAIAAMLARFHAGGAHFHWEFFEPLADTHAGYARYRFSYVSKVPESAGRVIAFEGISRFVLQDGLIAHYAEVFDRGAAFVQLGFAPGKVARLLEKYTRAQDAAPQWQAHRQSAGR
jgi:limonene-1,2-epoxide hydrolase